MAQKEPLFFASNLKFLRQRQGVSQQDLADTLEISRSKLNSYERGVQPSFPTQIKISNYFNLTLDTLVRHDLRTLSEQQLRQIESSFQVDATGKNLRLLTLTVDPENKENIEMVPVKAQAGYTSGFHSPEFIQDLQRFQLPFLARNRSYRSFQIKGDSMPPVQENNWVTGAYVTNWNEITDGKAYVLVTKDEGIVFKRVYKKDKTLLLVSTNPRYSPYEIPLNEILEVWELATYNSFGL